MKIAIWNCMYGLGNPMQINCFNDLNVDLAIFPELKQKNIEQLQPTDAAWVAFTHPGWRRC
jgi:hypothetical protein